MKTVYLYDAETNEFSGAHKCQLNTINGEDYDVPWNALPVSPPKLKKNEVAVVNVESQKWEIKDDYRNEKGYSTENGQEVEITELGELPSNVTLEARPSSYHSFSKGKWVITKADAARKKADEDKVHNQQIFEQIEQLEKKQQRPLREAALANKESEKNAALARVKAIDAQVKQLRTTLKLTQ